VSGNPEKLQWCVLSIQDIPKKTKKGKNKKKNDFDFERGNKNEKNNTL